MRRTIVALSASAALCVACGGSVAAVPGDAAADGMLVDASGGDAGQVTPCSAPGDLKLCGGQCGQSCPIEKCYSMVNHMPGPQLGVCVDSNAYPPNFPRVGCNLCPDGYLCALPAEQYKLALPDGFTQYHCMSPAVAQMYALNGRKDLSLYADRSTYTDAPLPPPPETCPTFPGLRLCGGTCGGCEPGETCMGRSPLHPYSMCVRAKGECIRGNPGGIDMGIKYRCLTFKVDDAAQPTADRWSVYAREEQCLAAAQYYPGGAFCGP